MTTRIKTALILFVTLILGVLLGALGSRALVEHKIRRTFEMRNPAIFVRAYMAIIQPEGEQAKQVRRILEEHARRISGMRMEFSAKVQESWELLRKELESILTEEQKTRLSGGFPRHLRRMPPWSPRPFRRGRPEPPPDKSFPY